MKNNKTIYIFDTTLRDGQQSPGAGMSFEDNIAYAEKANKLGIDVLEAGFPAASQYDFDIVQSISNKMAEKNSNMIIAALCQLREEQVIRTMEALKPSLSQGKARLHTYVPVDPNLMGVSLGRMADDHPRIIKEVYRLIKMAVDSGFEVEFSPEGYSRMQHNFDFVTDIIREAVSAGATVINCPDTIGGASRWDGEDYFVKNMQRHADIIEREFPEKSIIWSVHCHNDMGLALENTMEAVFNGPARQIEGCINGVGERAGNAPLEQCIMVIDQFGEKAGGFKTNMAIAYLKEISDFIAEKMLPRQPHSPICGDNAARHSSGGHTNAILKNPNAYQPFDPKFVGNQISFVFGPLSGGNHAKEILNQYGFYCPEGEKAEIAQAVKKTYMDRRKGITDLELVSAFRQYRAPIKAKIRVCLKGADGISSVSIEGDFFSKKRIKIQYSDIDDAIDSLHKTVKEHFPAAEVVSVNSKIAVQNTGINGCKSTVSIRSGDGECFVGEAIDKDRDSSVINAYIDSVNQAYVNTFHKINRKKIKRETSG